MKSVHEIPVTGLGSHRVGSKQSHSENFRLRVGFSGKSATNNMIIVNLNQNEYKSIFKQIQIEKVSRLKHTGMTKTIQHRKRVRIK